MICPTICSSYSSLIFFFFLCVLFLSKGNVLKITTKFSAPFLLFHNIVARVIVCLYSVLVMLSGDVKINPRLLSNCKEYFSMCHCNLNSNINDNGNGLLATSTLHGSSRSK